MRSANCFFEALRLPRITLSRHLRLILGQLFPVAGARRTDSLLALIALFLFHRALKSMSLIWGLEGRQVICSFTEGTEA